MSFLCSSVLLFFLNPPLDRHTIETTARGVIAYNQIKRGMSLAAVERITRHRRGSKGFIYAFGEGPCYYTVDHYFGLLDLMVNTCAGQVISVKIKARGSGPKHPTTLDQYPAFILDRL